MIFSQPTQDALVTVSSLLAAYRKSKGLGRVSAWRRLVSAHDKASALVAEELSEAAEADADFDGETYDPALDHHRNSCLLGRVFERLAEGGWNTLTGLKEATGGSEAGVSARIRDLRKKRFGGWIIDSERVGDSGLWQYRMRNPDGSDLPPVRPAGGQFIEAIAEVIETC